jgi:hypothetical protein
MPLPHPDDRTIDYRGVSGLAIAALVLGLLSPVAFVAPLLWSVPIFAIGFAWAAMHRIKAGGGELVGGNMALLGLLLAVLSGSRRGPKPWQANSSSCFAPTALMRPIS